MAAPPGADVPPTAFPGVKLEPLAEELEADIKPSPAKRVRPFGSTPFNALEERAIRQRLDVGLSRSETTQRPGPAGTRLTYIEGWKVIHDANQIFGFNGWSSHVVTLDLRYVEELNHRYCACVCATVRITLRDGAYREDRGGGVAENMRSKGDAILKAEKEAVTDATKRALKNFGLRLGLSLYDKQHVRDMNRPQTTPYVPPNHGGAHTPQASRPAPGMPQAGVPAGQAGSARGVASVTPGAAGKQIGGVQRTGQNGGGTGSNWTEKAVGTGAAGAPTPAPVVAPAGDAKGRQYAAQREQALRRKRAFLQAQAAKERAQMQSGLGAGAGAGNAGEVGTRATVQQGQGGGNAELARRQREIEELNGAAMRDFLLEDMDNL